MIGPFTSDRWKVIPPSLSRWLIASRLSSADEVNRIHRRAFKDHVPDRRVSRDRVVDQVLDETGVREVEAGVHAERQDFRVGHDLVACDIAESRGPRDLAHHRHMRPRRTVEVEEDRETYARQQPRLHALDQREEDRGGHCRAIGPGIDPGVFERAQVHQR